jgi:aromatic ring-opening dioxygenase catalytic subunit (LigB family)
MMDPQRIMDFVHNYSIRREMALFARTGRPIHAFLAYRWIREAGLPVPPWFLEYLDLCAERLEKPIRSRRNKSLKRLN